MIQIGDVVVSFDVLREKFICNLDACKGACCVEGDAGAPVELDEIEKLEEVLPVIWEELAPEARAVIEKQGVVYTDCEGDLVTSIVNNKDCVFTCYDEKGCCYCAIEKAYRDGKTDFYKPVSCHLYPIRVGNYGVYKAVNYNRWDVCKAAVLLARRRQHDIADHVKCNIKCFWLVVPQIAHLKAVLEDTRYIKQAAVHRVQSCRLIVNIDVSVLACLQLIAVHKKLPV